MGEVRCTDRVCGDGGLVDAAVVDGPTVGRCVAQDARGEGACDGFFGYAWNGSTCVSVSGCRCVGSDCPAIARERASCVELHGDCLVISTDAGTPSTDI